jgi:hypothetical protein
LCDSSFNEGVPEAVGAADIQDLGLKVGVLAKVEAVAFADVVTVVDEFLVEEVEFVFGGDNSHTRLRGEDFADWHLQREGRWLPFVEEPVVEQFPRLGAEDEGVGAGLEVHYLFVFVELVVGSAEGGQLVVAHDQRVGPGSENPPVVYSPAVDATVV